MNPNGNRAAWIQGPSGQCDKSSVASAVRHRLVLLGAPGVGKGTQAELLNQRLGVCHLSTGDVFRAAGNKPECDLSPAMQAAVSYMRRGELVPDSTVWEMVKERKGCLRCGGGFILDGFPRTIGQAERLKQLMEEEGITLSAVINYDLPLSEIVARLSGRRTCEKCKAVYHIVARPPRVQGCCDHCDGKLFQREDDRPESIKVRLDAYRQSTAPLITFYQRMGLLVQVPADGSAAEVFERTISQLKPQKAALA